MDSKRSKEVINELKKYLPVKRKIAPSLPAKIGKYLSTLLKNEKELETFFADPEARLKKAGINPSQLDLDLFIELLVYLKGKKARIEKWVPQPERSPLGESIKTKETETEQQWNFDHDSKYIFNVEHDYYSERGRQATKTKSEIVLKDKGFEKRGIGFDPSILLSPELRENYYPSQPLVTPELISKIKEILEK
ncbi:MAG: hypothetical protein JXR79_07685 [Nitrospirae bacterium]|nr:hypothetical protein [Nitrospirota bacterium]